MIRERSADLAEGVVSGRGRLQREEMVNMAILGKTVVPALSKGWCCMKTMRWILSNGYNSQRTRKRWSMSKKSMRKDAPSREERSFQ